jgi:hypothetical protein
MGAIGIVLIHKSSNVVNFARHCCRLRRFAFLAGFGRHPPRCRGAGRAADAGDHGRGGGARHLLIAPLVFSRTSPAPSRRWASGW